MAMQFRVVVEIEGSSPDIFKIGFEFSDEEGSGIEFYSNHNLPEGMGWVRIGGEIWRARGSRPLLPGARIKVVARDGLVVVVEPA